MPSYYSFLILSIRWTSSSFSVDKYIIVILFDYLHLTEQILKKLT